MGTFSLFATIGKLTPTIREANYENIYTILTSGSFAGHDLARTTDLLRASDNKAVQASYKKSLPFLTVSARYFVDAPNKDANFYERDEKGKKIRELGPALDHSGELCFDFDHLTPADFQRLHEAFKAADDTALLFTSPRGAGLKRFVTVEGMTFENHKAVYYAGMLHHWHTFQANADETCTNINRGTYLPADATAHYNPTPKQWQANELINAYPDAENKAKFIARQHKKDGDVTLIPADVVSWQLAPKPAPKAVAVVAAAPVPTYSPADNLRALEYIVGELESRSISLSTSHATNIKIGWALRSIDAPSTWFHRITRLNPDYDFDKMEQRYADLEKNFDGERCGFGSLVNLAKEAGISQPRPQRVTVNGQQPRLTQMDIRDAIKPLYSIYFDAGSETYYYAPAGENNPFNFTAFSAKSTFLNELLGELEQENVHVSKTKLEETLFNKTTYSLIDYLPMQLDWLASQYDGSEYLSTLVASVQTEDNVLFADWLTKWLVSLVAQVYGTSRNDNAFVLVGEQGVGKTGFFEFLLWSDKWFTTKPDFDFNNKNHLLLMNQKALILLDEMGQYSKADIKQLKAAFSQPKITADRKFHETADYKRNASFAGCSNNSDFLKDDTGDRRFLVFQMLAYDQALYNTVDKQQLWGELVSMYRAGFNYKFSADEVRTTIQRNLAGYTLSKPEDVFIDDCLFVSGESTDYLSNAELMKLLNQWRTDHNVRDHMTESAVRAKLKLAGATVSVARKIAGKTVRGIAGARLRRVGDGEGVTAATAAGLNEVTENLFA